MERFVKTAKGQNYFRNISFPGYLLDDMTFLKIGRSFDIFEDICSM